MRVEVVSSRGQIAKRTGWALRLLITQSFGNIVRTRLVSPLVFCGPSLPKPSHGGAPWWPRKRRKATWHVCGTASIRAGVLITSFLFLRMCFPLHSDRKKTPEINRICLQTRCHHCIRYKGLRCPLYWIVPPRSPNFNVASEFGRPTRAETGVFFLVGQ